MPDLPGAAHGQHDGAAPDESLTDARPPRAARAAARIRVRRGAPGAETSAAGTLLRSEPAETGAETSAAATLLLPEPTDPPASGVVPDVAGSPDGAAVDPAAPRRSRWRVRWRPRWARRLAAERVDITADPAAPPPESESPAEEAEAAPSEGAARAESGGRFARIAPRLGAARARLPSAARTVLDLVCGAGAFAAGVVVVVELWGFLTRPLWGDELWRAYYVSKTGNDFFRSLPTIDAPLPAGFVLLGKAMIRIFGNTELALKAPVLCALPVLALVTYRLCRRVAGPITSLVAGGTVVIDSAVLVYATQYKQYVLEALAAAVALLLFLRATEATRRAPRLRNAGGAGFAALFGSPVIFILLPLGVAYLVRGVVLAGRRGFGRPAWLRRVGLDTPLVAVLATGPGLVHAATFLRWQGGRVRTAGNLHPWVPDYLPAHDTTHWLWFRLSSWIPEFVIQGVPSPPDLGFPGLHRPSHLALHWITVGLMIGIVAGVAAATRLSAARWLLVAVVGAAGVGLLLSAQHVWPFGWARVNIFMIPLLHMLVAAGVGSLVSAARYVRGHRPARAAVWATSGAALACCVAGAVAAIGFNIGEVRAVRPDVHRLRTLGDMREIVQHVRETAAPTDVAIVPLGNRAFIYYMDDYTGYRGQASDGARIPAAQVFSTGKFADPASARFVKAHPHAEHVYVFEQRGITSKVHRDDVFWMGTVGFHPSSRYGLPGGLLTVFTRP